MEYREYLPAIPLQPYVQSFWVLRGEQAAPTADRVFPDGCTELIFHRGDPFALLGDDGRVAHQPKALYFGQIERFIVLRPARRVETLGVRFRAVGAAPLLRVSADETSGHAADFGDLCGRPARELQERVCDAPSVPAAIRHINDYLVARLDAVHRIDPVVASAVAKINATSGSISVGDMARSVGIGVRQLERKFAAGVGLSPKKLATIARLQEAFALIETGDCSPLTDVAHACGYFDHSHFIRDFRRLAGLSPSSFLREDRGVGRFFVAR